MARVFWILLACAACRANPPAPETELPRFAALTPEGIVVHDGETRAPIPDTEDVDTFCWAPDGQSLLATTKDALVAIAPDGSRRPISSGWFAIRFPDVSPNGKQVAVGARRKRGEAWGVWTLRLDGEGTPTRLVDGYDPSWSGDGNSIYFERYKPNVGLSVFHLNSDGATPFLDDGRHAFTVECAPSGRMILFTRGRALTLYEAGTSVVRELTGQETYNRFPSISPGERYVLFFRDDPTGQTHPERGLVIYDLQTQTEQVLEIPAELALFAP